MSFTFTLPDGYKYVGAALLSTVYLLAYQTTIVVKYRKRAAIKYPQAYAEKTEQEKSTEAMQFNCAQRAHQNTLELLPGFYISTIIAGLKFPHFAASACVIFVIGRIAYTRGYVTGDPNKRNNLLNRISSISFLAQLLTATCVAGQWVLPGLVSKLGFGC